MLGRAEAARAVKKVRAGAEGRALARLGGADALAAASRCRRLFCAATSLLAAASLGSVLVLHARCFGTRLLLLFLEKLKKSKELDLPLGTTAHVCARARDADADADDVGCLRRSCGTTRLRRGARALRRARSWSSI
eukprot:6206938-Pleurochrysis_carterae.AAC.2